MHFSRFLAAVGLVAAVGAASTFEAEEDPHKLMKGLNEEVLQLLQDAESSDNAKRAPGACTLAKATIRKDWAAMCPKERKKYIEAVKCFQSKPSISDPNWAPGARSRFDDFVAIHIDKTREIHGTGNFLTWHRHFTWAYEQALKKECGYQGAQPYWNWFANQDDITKSPVYDGSEYSMGSQGAYFKHEGLWAGRGLVLLPPGEGGGCSLSGPFKDMEVRLGPVSPGMKALPINPNGPLGYNPRCLRRDITNTPMEYMTAENLYNLTLGTASRNVGIFQDELQGRPNDLFIGIHASGHFVSGGEASDVYSSPVDPTFYLHHAMVDRLYWIWQSLHPLQAKTVAGTITISNTPPSRDALPTDILDIGVNGKKIQLQEAWDTLAGPYCYIYV